MQRDMIIGSGKHTTKFSIAMISILVLAVDIQAAEITSRGRMVGCGGVLPNAAICLEREGGAGLVVIASLEVFEEQPRYIANALDSWATMRVAVTVRGTLRDNSFDTSQRLVINGPGGEVELERVAGAAVAPPLPPPVMAIHSFVNQINANAARAWAQYGAGTSGFRISAVVSAVSLTRTTDGQQVARVKITNYAMLDRRVIPLDLRTAEFYCFAQMVAASELEVGKIVIISGTITQINPSTRNTMPNSRTPTSIISAWCTFQPASN